MIARTRIGLLAPLFLCLLTACGGGGGGSNNTPTPPPGSNNPPPTTPPPTTTTPTAEDIANARSTGLKVNLRSDTKELTITWQDAFAAETGYTVEAKAAGSTTWQVLESLPAGQATGTPYQWQRVINASSTYRVKANRDGYSVPLEIAQDVSEIPVDPASPMSIELDPAPPVPGQATLSIANAATALRVDYFVDLQSIHTSLAAPLFQYVWNSKQYTDGEHLLIAHVHVSQGVVVELRRTIVVDNPAVAVSLVVFTRGPQFGDTVWLQGTATAEAGIQQLEFFANGNAVQVIQGSGQTSFPYEFWISMVDLPGGTNTFRAVATDTGGLTAEATYQFDINNRPRLTVTSPANGALVRNTLQLEGTFSEDVSTATVTATLGQVQIMQLPPQASGSFDIDYSLAGLPAGEYTLTVAAVDAAGRTQTVVRRVIVPTSQLVYELVASDVAELLATDAGAVLYRKTDGAVVLRSAAGVETTLQVPTNISFISDWQLDNGYMVMSAQTSTSARHVFVFDSSGQVTNLSLPGGAEYNQTPKLKHPWVTWYSEGTTESWYQIYNLNTDAVTVVSKPAAATRLWADFDLVTTPGAEQLFFSAKTDDGTTSEPLSDMFRYTLQTQATDLLTGGDARIHSIRTDNSRLALLTRQGFSDDELFVAPVSNATTLTSFGGALDTYHLRDGLLVWRSDGDSPGIKANDGTTTMDVGSPGTVYSVSGGRVLFDEYPPKLVSWSATGGKQTLLQSLPISALHDGTSAFITTGASDSMLLYRITLP